MQEKSESKIIKAEELVGNAGLDGRAENKPKPAVELGSGVSASASHRGLYVPPDRPPPTWWSRHRRHIQMAEWGACLLFSALAVYFLVLLLFPGQLAPPPAPPPPSRDEFRRLLRSAEPIRAEPEWGVEAKGGRWRSIVLHHSATASGSPESFDQFHRQVRKWEDGLGYHFVIGNGNGMPDGQVAMSKRWREQLNGAHVVNNDKANTYSSGICLVGNFNDSLPTPRQLASLKGLLAFLRKEYGIGLASIVGHNAVSEKATDCPGKFFFVDEVALALANP